MPTRGKVATSRQKASATLIPSTTGIFTNTRQGVKKASETALRASQRSETLHRHRDKLNCRRWVSSVLIRSEAGTRCSFFTAPGFITEDECFPSSWSSGAASGANSRRLNGREDIKKDMQVVTFAPPRVKGLRFTSCQIKLRLNESERELQALDKNTQVYTDPYKTGTKKFRMSQVMNQLAFSFNPNIIGGSMVGLYMPERSVTVLQPLGVMMALNGQIMVTLKLEQLNGGVDVQAGTEQ
ncbi:Hypothetical predicted protein [Scomber scombrus]|uniref:Uncharacterized protein n=1 Tax=Scomber scombrus TaxID=13677 RepID=A0AAV1PD26_SCOSC